MYLEIKENKNKVWIHGKFYTIIDNISSLSGKWQSQPRQTTVKVGRKRIHFSLDGCTLSCYFSGNVATLRDALSHQRGTEDEGRGLSYTYRRSLLRQQV